MDKWQAQHKLWSSFGYPAYDASSVPDGDDEDNRPSFPYITYQGIDGVFDSDTPSSISIWTRSYSWIQANTISNPVLQALKNGGITVKYDEGIIWVTLGDPASQNMGDPNDDLIRRKVISILIHFL